MEGDARGIGFMGQINQHIGSIGDLHFPDIEHIIHDLTHENWRSDLIKKLIMAWIAGSLTKDLGIHPTLTKISRMAEKMAPNLLEGVAWQTILEYSTVTHSPKPYDTNEKHMYNRVVRYANRPTNFSNTWLYAQ